MYVVVFFVDVCDIYLAKCNCNQWHGTRLAFRCSIDKQVTTKLCIAWLLPIQFLQYGYTVVYTEKNCLSNLTENLFCL